MNEELHGIPERILALAVAALTHANMHAAFLDPGSEHWPPMSILNAAHAGELVLKAIIASEHPLLIFRDLFGLDDSRAEELDLNTLLQRGRTHDFEKLPQVLWAVTGIRIPNPGCYERLRSARNAIQHFCSPNIEDLGGLSLEFIYTIVDPLLAKHFGLFAIEYHEDHLIGYDHLVGCLLRRELQFSIPADFAVTEIDLAQEIAEASDTYKSWLRGALKQIGKESLLNG
jgi:hypothetical protein